MNEQNGKAPNITTVALRRPETCEAPSVDESIIFVLEEIEKFWAARGIEIEGRMPHVLIKRGQEKGWIPTALTDAEIKRFMRIFPCWGGMVIECRNPKGHHYKVIEEEVEKDGRGAVSRKQIERVLNHGYTNRAIFERVVEAIKRLDEPVKFQESITVTVTTEPVPEGWRVSVRNLPIPPVTESTLLKAQREMQLLVDDYLMNELNGPA
jgi:hypothetical protein